MPQSPLTTVPQSPLTTETVFLFSYLSEAIAPLTRFSLCFPLTASRACKARCCSAHVPRPLPLGRRYVTGTFCARGFTSLWKPSQPRVTFPCAQSRQSRAPEHLTDFSRPRLFSSLYVSMCVCVSGICPDLPFILPCRLASVMPATYGCACFRGH